MTIERELVQRAVIPQSIHGFTNSAVLRGASWWLGDLYLYVFDAGVAYIKKVALNGTVDEYVVQGADFTDWDHPFVDTGSNNVDEFLAASHAGNSRYYPGLHVTSNYSYIFTPNIDASGYACLHIAPTDKSELPKFYELEWAEKAADFEVSQAYDLYSIPYETINGAHVGSSLNEIFMQVGREAEGAVDSIQGPFDLSFVNMLVSKRDRKLTMHRNFKLTFSSEEVDGGTPVGVIKAFDDYIALYHGGSSDVAIKIRAAHDRFEKSVEGVAPHEDFYGKVMGSIEWFLDDSNEWLLSYQYGAEQDRFFYAIRFDDTTNDLEIWPYQDKATRCSSLNSIVSLSKSKIKFGGGTPVKMEATFIDAFGADVPEGQPVLFRIKDNSNPLMGSLSLYEAGPFFDCDSDPIHTYVWGTVDANHQAVAYFLSPRTQDVNYTEVVEIIAGFELYDGLSFEES